MYSLTGIAPQIKFDTLTFQDIDKFENQLDNFVYKNELNKFKIQPQVSVYAKGDTVTYYSAELLLKNKYGLWNDSYFLSLDKCTTDYNKAVKYTKELEKYIKFKVLEQSIEEFNK